MLLHINANCKQEPKTPWASKRATSNLVTHLNILKEHSDFLGLWLIHHIPQS